MWRAIFSLYCTARPQPGVFPMMMGAGKPPIMLPMPTPPGPLPEAGGVLDQCAWLMDVFDLMSVEDAVLIRQKR